MAYIALQMLLGDRGKYIAMIIGIGFAALIMTQQPAIFLGLLTRTYSFVNDVSQPDIWVMDPGVQFVEENKPLRDTDLQRVRGIEGVGWAVPFFKALLSVRLPDGKTRLIDLNGLDDATLIGGPPRMLKGQLADLRQADGLIIDEDAARNRLNYTDSSGRDRPLGIGDSVEINDKRAVVVGIGKSSRTFTLQPLAFTTYSRAINYTPKQRRMMSYVLVKAQDGQNPDDLARRIAAKTGLAAYTRAQFSRLNLDYWMKNTGIPINFGIAVTLGFLVGAAIAGQTFYNFVRENLKQFAALKAMGVRDGAMIRLVLLQAAVVGVIGYGLGVGLTSLFGLQATDSVLAFYMPWQLLVFSGVGVGLIVLVSALIGVRAVLRLDAAEVFRS